MGMDRMRRVLPLIARFASFSTRSHRVASLSEWLTKPSPRTPVVDNVTILVIRHQTRFGDGRIKAAKQVGKKRKLARRRLKTGWRNGPCAWQVVWLA